MSTKQTGNNIIPDFESSQVSKIAIKMFPSVKTHYNKVPKCQNSQEKWGGGDSKEI